MPVKKDPHGNPTRNALMLFSMLLFSGRAYNLKQLSEILNCSRQSVMRLIEQIELCGEYGNIEKTVKNGQNHYQIKKIRSKPNVEISPQELEQLVYCREWLQHLLPAGVHSQLEQSTEKAATLLKDYAEREEILKPVASSVTKGSVDYSGYEKTLEALVNAIKKRQVLEIHYYSPKSDSINTYEVVPIRIVAFREGLYARTVKVTPSGEPQIIQPTTLALHRMKKIFTTRRYLSEKIEIPDFKENEHFGIAKQGEPFIVKAKFYGKAKNYVKERTWGQEQEIIEHKDSIELSFSSQSELEIVKWILSFGAEATLLEPAHLREQVLTELKDAIAKY